MSDWSFCEEPTIVGEIHVRILTLGNHEALVKKLVRRKDLGTVNRNLAGNRIQGIHARIIEEGTDLVMNFSLTNQRERRWSRIHNRDRTVNLVGLTQIIILVVKGDKINTWTKFFCRQSSNHQFGNVKGGSIGISNRCPGIHIGSTRLMDYCHFSC